MKIKVHCLCATRFEFEIEPVNGRMPMPVNCPGCGTDATELANEVITKQLAAPKPKVAMHVNVQPRPAADAPSASVPAAAPVPAAPRPPAPKPAAVVSALGAGPIAPPSGGTNLKFGKPSVAPAAAPPTASPIGASRVAPPSGGTGLKFNKPAAPEAPTGGEPPLAPDIGAPQFCARHGSEPAVETCKVCGKPICPKCMEQFGYICSAYCREAAVHKKIKVPKFKGQRAVIDGRKSSRTKVLAATVGVLVMGTISGLCWYTWFARNPKVVYSMDFPKPKNDDGDYVFREDGYFRLIGPNQLLAIKSKQVSLTEVLGQKQLWSARLQTEQEEAAVKAAIAKNEETRNKAVRVRDPETGRMITRMGALDPLEYEGEYAYANPRVVVTTNDIWVATRSRLTRFDRQSGSRKETGIQDKIDQITPSDDVILVVTEKDKGAQSLTRILLPGGSSETEELPLPPRGGAAARPTVMSSTTTAARGGAAPAARGGAVAPATMTAGRAGAPATAARGARGPVTTNATAAAAPANARGTRGTNTAAVARGAVSQAATAKASAPDDFDFLDFYERGDGRYTPSGQGVIEFKSKLVERRTQTRQAMRAAPAKPLLEDKNLKASQGLDVAEEMLNDMQRSMTGGVEREDISLYQVTLHRHFAGGVEDWTGEVVGEPSLVPLKTIDIVTGFTNLYAIDKSNKKLWEAKLTYPVASSYYYEDRRQPALETKDAVYFVDKGMVTRFDPATGNVRWRVTTVSAFGLESDGKGGLYIDTTADVPESIELTQEIKIRKKDERVVMKVDEATGKIVWQSKFPGYEFHVQPEGRFVYTTRIWQTQDPLRLEEGPDTHFNLKLVNPSTGDLIWNHVQHNKHFIRADMHDNWIMLQFSDRVEILKFFSL